MSFAVPQVAWAMAEANALPASILTPEQSAGLFTPRLPVDATTHRPRGSFQPSS